jgi:hypothetical protein
MLSHETLADVHDMSFVEWRQCLEGAPKRRGRYLRSQTCCMISGNQTQQTGVFLKDFRDYRMSGGKA